MIVLTSTWDRSDPRPLNQVVTEPLANLFVKAVQWLHLTLQKFHHLTDMLGMGKAKLGDVINDGRFCDLENFSMTRL